MAHGGDGEGEEAPDLARVGATHNKTTPRVTPVVTWGHGGN